MPERISLVEAPTEDVLIWEDTWREPFDRESLSPTFLTNRGNIAARYHPVPEIEKTVLGGVVWVGGARGGLDGPAHGLYPEACQRLQRKGIAGLRLHYRHPNEFEECVIDTLLGIEFLKEEGFQRLVLVGHSFGGAVVITAAALCKFAKAVISISTQTYGTDLAPDLSPRPILLIHGIDDEILPCSCSKEVFQRARDPKQLVLFPGARHGMDEVRERLLDLLVEWIPEQLRSYTDYPK